LLATDQATRLPRFSRRLQEALGPIGIDRLSQRTLDVMIGYLPANADSGTFRDLCAQAGLNSNDYDTWQDFLDMLLGLG
jgi:hypothetical protein